jgi:hypothetical protein
MVFGRVPFPLLAPADPHRGATDVEARLVNDAKEDRAHVPRNGPCNVVASGADDTVLAVGSAPLPHARPVGGSRWVLRGGSVPADVAPRSR